MDMGRAFREEIGGYNNIYINTTTFTTTFTFTFTTIGRYNNIYINTTKDHCQLKKEMKSLDISYSGTVSGQQLVQNKTGVHQNKIVEEYNIPLFLVFLNDENSSLFFLLPTATQYLSMQPP